MKEEFVTFEIAKNLKDSGFDWETKEVYERNILACRYENYPKPTIPQVLEWLREEKKIYIDVVTCCHDKSSILWTISIIQNLPFVKNRRRQY